MRLRLKTGRREGFTLIELLIVTVLLTVVISTMAYAFYDILRTSAISRVRMQMQQDLRDTVGYMSRMIRYAGIRPVDTAVEEATGIGIIFQGDYDADGIVDRISFQYDANAKTILLSQWVKNGGSFDIVHDSQVVMSNVTDLSFTYYTAENVVTTNPALVTAIRLQVTLEPPNNVPPRVRNVVGSMRKSTLVYCPNLAWRLAP
jgi:prepilin-type N-terminal cleavage/methylation domain-containing protein